MKIVIAGGTGFIGRALTRHLAQGGHRVTVLSRTPAHTRGKINGTAQVVQWDVDSSEAWPKALDGVDAVINLAGAPIMDARWTETRKRLLWESRLAATRTLVDAMKERTARPCTLVNASGVGYYGASDDRTIDEDATAGNGFLAHLCVAWEAEARRAEQFGARVVRLRIGMVLESDGGALPKMVVPFRLFLGGPVLPGTQWVSWIERSDLVRLIEWVLATPQVSGAVNAVAPQPVTMKEFCRTLGRVMRRPSWMPVPGIALRFALGELATVLTTGQRVVPAKAIAAGYKFSYPELEVALRSLYPF